MCRKTLNFYLIILTTMDAKSHRYKLRLTMIWIRIRKSKVQPALIFTCVLTELKESENTIMCPIAVMMTSSLKMRRKFSILQSKGSTKTA